MSTYVKTIKDGNGDIIYPQTKISAIYDENNINLQTILNGKSQIKVLNLTLTSGGWSNNTQTLSATGVTASNSVIITPAVTALQDWSYYGVVCSAQSANALEFTCDETPSTPINVNVIIFD